MPEAKNQFTVGCSITAGNSLQPSMFYLEEIYILSAQQVCIRSAGSDISDLTGLSVDFDAGKGDFKMKKKQHRV